MKRVIMTRQTRQKVCAVLLASLTMFTTAFLVVTSRSAEATCYECSYIFFVGNVCNVIGGQGGSGKTQCYDDGTGCHLAGSVCAVDPKPSIIVKERP